MTFRRSSFALALALLALVCGSSAAFGADDGWVFDANEKGVVVTTKTEASRHLPMFRGVTTIDGGAFEVLAVLYDAARVPEWMASCKGARILRPVSEVERIEYNHIGAPWPVSDRDTVVRSWVEANPTKGELWARFASTEIPEGPPVTGIVRMPRVEGYYHMEPIDPDHTLVTYQVDADPGGLLPDWVVKLTSRRLPIETLAALRRQVAKTRGEYTAFVTKYDPAKGGKLPAAALIPATTAKPSSAKAP
jgi:hypothetical protein